MDQYKDPWIRLYALWDEYYTPPGRPSNDDIENYRLLIKKYDASGTALVLGATPELRNLLHELGFRITSLDINPHSFQYLDKLVPESKKEEKRIGDWCSIPLPDESFDVILGDVPVANVPSDLQASFYRNMSRMLRPSGVFIHRAELVRAEDYENDYAKVIELYGRKPMPRNIGPYSLEFMACLLMKTIKRGTDLVSAQESLTLMEKAAEEHPKLKPLYEYQRHFWGNLDKKWVFETEEAFVKRMKEHFEVVDRRVSEDNAMKELWPIFACRKRMKKR